LIDQFRGPSGQRRLAHLISDQELIRHDLVITNEIIVMLEATPSLLQEYAKGDDLICQGERSQNGILLLLAGSVALYSNQNYVTELSAGQAIGEFPILDPKLTHEVTATALETTVVIRLPEERLLELTHRHPQIWQTMAAMLARRLRETSALFWSPNERPRVFVGSSTEGLAIARCLQSSFSHDPVDVRIWTDGVFEATDVVIESLFAELDFADFAVLVATPDDQVIQRGLEQSIIRDNVLFELGLFMGRLGRERTFLVQPRGASVRLPSDLLGLVALDYALGSDNELDARLGPVVSTLRRHITKAGPLTATGLLIRRELRSSRRPAVRQQGR